MYVVNHHENCGEYRYCPERHGEVVSLRGSCSGQDGLRFSRRGAKIRMGYFFRIFVLLVHRVRERIRKVSGREFLTGRGYRSQVLRREICCARL